MHLRQPEEHCKKYLQFFPSQCDQIAFMEAMIIKESQNEKELLELRNVEDE
jgi:hypothetical protein